MEELRSLGCIEEEVELRCKVAEVVDKGQRIH